MDKRAGVVLLASLTFACAPHGGDTGQNAGGKADVPAGTQDTTVHYGDRSFDIHSFVGISDDFLRFTVDSTTNDIYWIKTAFQGVQMVRVPFENGAWNQDHAEVVADLGRRTAFDTRFDAGSHSVYMVADENNNALFNLYRFDVTKRTMTKLSNTFQAYGYGFDAQAGAAVLIGQSVKDGPFCLQQIDVETLKSVNLVCDTPQLAISGSTYPVLDAKGARVASAFQKDNDRGQQNLGIVRGASGMVEIVTDPAIARSRVYPLMWDGDRVYFVTNEEKEPGGLYVYDDSTHKIALVRHNTAPFAADDAAEFADPKARRVVLTDKVDDKEKLVIFDLATQKDVLSTDKSTFHYAYLTDFLSPTADGSYLAAVDSVAISQPSRFLMRIDPTANTADKAISVGFDPKENKELVSACKSEIITYPTFDMDTDGKPRMINAVLHHPASEPDSPAAVIWLHGGPDDQSTQAFDEKREMLCHLGYTVLAPNYRGSTGQGAAFQDLNNGDWCGGDYLDIEHGRQFLKGLGIDESRIGVGGHSFGGYLTNCALTKDGDHFAFGMAMAGMSDLLIELASTDVPDLFTSDMGDPNKDPMVKQLYIDRSPVTHASNLHVPLVMANGTSDLNVPFAQVQEFNDRLQALNKSDLVTFVKLQDVSHYWVEVGVHVKTYQAMMDLLYKVAPVHPKSPISQP